MGFIDESPQHLHVKISIVIAAMVVVPLGLWDDTMDLKPRIKIAGQTSGGGDPADPAGRRCLGPMISPLNVRLAILHWPVVPIR